MVGAHGAKAGQCCSIVLSLVCKGKDSPELNQPGRHQSGHCAYRQEQHAQLGLLPADAVTQAPARVCIQGYQCIFGSWVSCKEVLPDVESVVPARQEVVQATLQRLEGTHRFA